MMEESNMIQIEQPVQSSDSDFDTGFPEMNMSDMDLSMGLDMGLDF